MKTTRILMIHIALVFVFGAASSALADKFSDTIAIYQKSDAANPFFKNAYGYAVFPTVGKGGLGIGGAYGKRQVYRQGKVTGTSKLFKATIGLQAGGQANSQMTFFQDKRRVDMVFGIGYGDDIAKAVLNDILKSHDKILDDPEPMMRLHTLGESSVDFIVRPWVKIDDYWEVYWDVTRTAKIRFDQ